MKDIFSTTKLTSDQKLRLMTQAINYVHIRLGYNEKPVLSEVYKEMFELITEDNK